MEDKTNNKYGVHKVLAHSYSIYFIFFLAGVALDLVFQFKVPVNPIIAPAGFVLLAFSAFLILWAQKTGWDLRKVKEVKMEHFCRGPYCYTRIPTQWGLFFLMLGFGIITNSFFVIVSTFISFIVSKFLFIEKHDRILAEKYGTAYKEYKKQVNL